MLQQTRVEAATGYYLRFLERFPTVAALAGADENEVLTAWAGLGYYSRARNLHRAAQVMADTGIPVTHAGVLELPGIGPYTAGALASISLGLPFASVDGNVVRVISRLTNDGSEISSPGAKRRFSEVAQLLVDPARPGDFNQAVMELGATVCVPRTPRCTGCPVREMCGGLQAGRQHELPVKLGKAPARQVTLDLVLLEKEGRVFLIRRSDSERRLSGFWELPEKQLIPGARTKQMASFGHRIVNDQFHVVIWAAVWREASDHLPEGMWFGADERVAIPLSTVTKKALAALAKTHS